MEISKLSLKEAINKTIEIWNHSPKVNKPTINISNYSQWPDPWELLSKEIYCNLAQNLGIFYTLKLSNHEDIQSIKFKINHAELSDSYRAIINDKNIKAINPVQVNTKLLSTTILDCDEQYLFKEIRVI